MLIKRLFFGGWRRFRKYTFIPLNVFLNMIIFLFREFFLGFENANNYLKRVSQTSIISILRMKGAKIGEGCNIQDGIVFHNCKNYSRLTIGENCHIGKSCFLDLRDNIIIGDNVVIAMNCTIITHMDMNNSNLRKKFKADQAPVFIDNDVYVGTNSVILMGVTIKEKAIVGASSLVIKNIESKTMVVGNPTVKIKNINGV